MSDSRETGSTSKAKQAKGAATHQDDGLTQSERFIKAAQELGTDDDPELFKERVRKIARQSVKSPPSNNEALRSEGT